MVATAFRCWVNPIAQQQMTRFELIAISAASRICSRVMPLLTRMSSQFVFSRSTMKRSKPPVKFLMKSRSKTTPGRFFSAASISFMIPFSTAISPLIRIGSQRSLSFWKSNLGTRNGFFRSCGFLNRKLPISGMGLIETIFAPASFACCRLSNIRG